MRVVLSTISKFHTFDLARQLEARGLLARLFTGRVGWRLRGENLPRGKVTTYPYLQTLFEGIRRLGIDSYPLKTELNWQCHRTLDEYVARNMCAAEVFHALAYCGLRSGEAARKIGAKWLCDAPTAHMVYHENMIAAEHDRLGLPYRRLDPRFVDYATESYGSADLVTVPSTYAKESFVRQAVPAAKVGLVPYGVDLREFQPVATPLAGSFRILFVGELSVHKGLHDLVDAVRLASIPGSELILVGKTTRFSGALLERAKHLPITMPGPVARSQLSLYYSTADVLVLPSISDAFGVVIGQALACGCPVVASEHSGGPDMITSGKEGFVIPIRSPEILADRLVWLHEHPLERGRMRQDARRRARDCDGWGAYGKAMVAVYDRAVGAQHWSRD